VIVNLRYEAGWSDLGTGSLLTGLDAGQRVRCQMAMRACLSEMSANETEARVASQTTKNFVGFCCERLFNT